MSPRDEWTQWLDGHHRIRVEPAATNQDGYLVVRLERQIGTDRYGRPHWQTIDLRDMAHGIMHRHRFRGRDKLEAEGHYPATENEAIAREIADLTENWEELVESWLRRS